MDNLYSFLFTKLGSVYEAVACGEGREEGRRDVVGFDVYIYKSCFIPPFLSICQRKVSL